MNNKNIFLISIVILLIIITSSVVISQNFQEESSTQNSLEDKESTIIQYPAVLDQPVKWKKSIITNSPSNITLKLPKDSKNINIKKIKDNKKEDITYTSSITGAIISENLNESVIVKFLKKILGALTGKVIDPGQEEEIEIKINDNSTEYEIEYETPAPYAVEEDIDRGKRIKIVGPENLHYENVLAFTEIPESPKDAIKLYRTTEEVREQIQITNYEDTNENSLIDYIEWVVPQLSNQTYELVIEITKAEHLDSNREFISDIYEEVKGLDDVWSETILAEHYVRVTFEQNLTSENDITIYPRVVEGNPRVEIYEKDGDKIIAEFTNIISNEYNKVFLTNLQGTQDVFDLRILDGSLKFEHIVDPQYASPASDIENPGAWTTEPLWDKIDEEPYDDGDYVISPKSASAGEAFTVGLSPVTDPGVHTDHTLRIRAQVSGVSGTFKFELLQGEVVIKDSGDIALPLTFQESFFTLLEAEAESITDYTTLSVRITAVATAKNKFQWVSWVRFEVPAAPNDPPTISGLPDVSDDEDFGTNNSVMDLRVYADDTEDPDDDLTYEIVSESNASVVDCGIYNSYYITCTSQSNVSGYSNVNVSVTDTGAKSATDVFTFTVDPVNDQPWVDGLSDPTNLSYNSGLNQDVISSTDIDNNFRDVEEDQNPTSVVILSETHIEIVNCEIDGSDNLDCTVQTGQSGTSTVVLNYTDSGDLYITDSIDVSVSPPESIKPIPSFGINPVNTYNDTDGSITFELKCSDNSDVDTLQLWSNSTGIWHANQTNSTPVNDTFWNVTVDDIPEGAGHIWGVWCNDSLNNEDWTNINRTFTVDSIGPTINTEGANETNITQNSYFCLNITATDSISGVDTVYAKVWNTASWVNYTMTDTGTSCGGGSDNVYGVEIHGTAQGIWNYSKVWANDTLNNWDSYDFDDLTINVTAPADSSYPQFSNFQEYLANDSDYLFGQNYQFNSTITNTNGTIFLNFDGTNYSATNDTATNFYVDFGSLSAGTYDYYWLGYGNGSLNNYNQSSTRSYVVQQATGSCAVNFNETSVTYPNTFLVWNNCTSGAVLYRNGTQITNNSEQILAAGTWNFTVIRNDTVNYTNIYDEQNFVVSQATSVLTKKLNGADENEIVTYPTGINVSASTTGGTVNIYRNSTNITSENNLNITLAANYYEYEFNITGNENYTDVSSVFLYATINQNTSSCSVFFNESSGITYPATFIVWTNCTSTYTLYRNGVSIDNNSEQALAASSYNFTVIRTDSANYSNYYDEQEFIVHKATGIVYAWINNQRENRTALLYNEEWLNATLNAGDSNENCRLYYNDTLIEQGTCPLTNLTNFTQVGLFNVTAFYDGNENWTNDYETWWVTVSTDSPPTVTIIYPENIIYNVNVSVLNYTVDDDISLSHCWYSLNGGETNSSPDADCSNHTGLISSEGPNTWTVYANDSIGQESSDSVTFTKDTIYPQVSIIYPQNTNYTVNVSELNYTYTETNCDSVWWNNGTNNSTRQNCGTNWTGLTSKEGSNTWTVYINDTSGNENSSSVTFNKDTAYPAVTINSPLNQTYNTNSILFNVTATDGSDVDSCWYSLTAGSYNYSMAETNPPEWDDTNSSMTQGSHTVNFYCNDSYNNLNDTEQETFFIDSIIPLVDFTTGTEDNSTTHSRDWIFVNVTVTETNEDTITFSLYNSTDIVNQTLYTDSTRTINWTGLPNEKYYYNVTINDTAGNSNSTETKTIILDTEGPQVSSLTESPTDPANYSESETYMFNATVIDPSLDIVWVDFNGTNYTATNIAGNIYNITLNNLAVGTYNYRWYANDSFSNLNGTENGTYTINQTTPSLNITFSPSDNESYGTQTTANGTGCPSQLTCNLYRNDTGEITPPDVATLGVGAYNYTYNTTGNANYTSTSVSDILTINKETGVVYTYLDNNRSNITINQQDYIWLNGTLETGQEGENITLYNNGTLINESATEVSNLTQFNNTGLHNITTTYDGNENYTSAYETWWVNVLEIDTTKPNVSIVYPSNNTNTTNANINVNYTVSDNQAVDSCWYSNSSGQYNYSITNCENLTTQTWNQGNNTVIIYLNDTSGNENSSSVTFFVDSINPTIQFVSPTETSGTSLGRNYIQVNVTASDDNLDTITIRLYNSTNDLIKTNISSSSPFNITYSSLSGGTYYFNATVNDTLNNEASTETKNVTLVLPLLTIIKPENETYLTNTSLLLNYIASYEDFVGYSLNLTESNTTISGNTTFNVSTEGQHTLYLYANNSVGTTTKNVTFTVNLTKFIIHYGNYHEGNSTNFNISSYEDLQNISNVILENTDGGKISFNEPINLTDDLNASDNEVDINSNINISSNRIEINSDALPNFNKSATLHFYGLSLSNPRVLRDEIVCPSVICTSPVYSSEAWVFNVTGFTVYSLEDIVDEEAPPTAPPSAGGGGRRIIYECINNSDCEGKDEICWNHKCVKLFDIKIIDFESPAKLGEFFEFTYLMKGMANISGDVEVNFWIEKDGEKVTSGSDTIYLGSFEEKTETTKIFLPTNIKSGVYTFYIQVLHQAYEAKSHRTIEIEVKEGIAEITPIDKEFKNYYLYYIIGILLLTIFIIFSKDKWLASLREWRRKEVHKPLKAEDIEVKRKIKPSRRIKKIKKKIRRFVNDSINSLKEFESKTKERIYKSRYKPEKPIDEKLEPPEPELEPVEKPEHLQILKKKFAEQMVEEVKKEYPKQPIKALKTKEEKQKEIKPKEPLYKPIMETKEEIPKEKEEESMNIIEDIVKKEQEEKAEEKPKEEVKEKKEE